MTCFKYQSFSVQPLALTILAGFQVILALAQPANYNAPGTNDDESIIFNSPLTATWRTNDGKEHVLIAYRNKRTHDILEEVEQGDSRRVASLQWFSSGKPVFVQKKAQNEDSMYATEEYLHNNSAGFFSHIQMLTEEQRTLLARQARIETNVSIKTDQIVNSRLEKFECKLSLLDKKTKKKHYIKGEVGELRTYPLRIDFDVPLGTVERELVDNAKPEDLKFTCVFLVKGKKIHTNTLSITAQQLLLIEPKLFGDAKGGFINDVYVTREQIAELSSELYSNLHIRQNYEMPEHAFTDEFVNGIITRMALDQFSQVPVEKVVASISKYAKDIPVEDRSTTDLGRLLKIANVGDKPRIVADRSQSSDESSTKTSFALSVDVSGERWGIPISFKAAMGYASSNEKKSSETIGSLDEQLEELNSLSKDEAQWKIEGDKIIPKSLNVMRLSRTRLGNDFKRTLTYESDVSSEISTTMYLDNKKQVEILVQQHYGGTAFFFRSWEDYKIGFGNTNGDYWIGNEKLHKLTEDGRYKLRVELQSEDNHEFYWAEYETFKVQGDFTKYTVWIGNYSGTAGDQLQSASGTRFSTHDSDNDRSSNTHCARDAAYGNYGGFWYTNCGNAFLNSPHIGKYGFTWKGIGGSKWHHWTSPSYDKLIFSRMTLLPK